MPTHGGQMGFIGGHKTSVENDPWITAQREFEEETSLSRTSIEFVGYLPVVMTARLQPIVPVMAKLLITTEELFQKIRSNGEWDDVVAYPWFELMKEDNWEFAWRNGYTKSPMMFHPLQRTTFMSQTSNFETHLLWGATASMVWDFLRLYYKQQS